MTLTTTQSNLNCYDITCDNLNLELGVISYSGLLINTTPVTITSLYNFIMIDTISIPITLYLPTALNNNNLYNIVDVYGNCSENNITIACDESDTIYGEASILLNIDYTVISLFSNGMNSWSIV
jgi:hypothetical protein